MRKKHDPYVEKLGLYLNRKLEIHLLIAVVFNIVSMIVVISVFKLTNFPLVVYNKIFGVIIYSIINTLVYEIIKLFLVRHLIDVIINTKGLVLVVVMMFVFGITSLIFKNDFYFLKSIFLTIPVFTIMYSLMKILLIIALQRMGREDN